MTTPTSNQKPSAPGSGHFSKEEPELAEEADIPEDDLGHQGAQGGAEQAVGDARPQ